MPLFKKNWKPIYEFEDKGSAVFMTSPLLDKATEEKITKLLLRNDEITTQVWQKNMGLGAFVAPARVN